MVTINFLIELVSEKEALAVPELGLIMLTIWAIYANEYEKNKEFI